jgi:hypothetical protein
MDCCMEDLTDYAIERHLQDTYPAFYAMREQEMTDYPQREQVPDMFPFEHARPVTPTSADEELAARALAPLAMPVHPSLVSARLSGIQVTTKPSDGSADDPIDLTGVLNENLRRYEIYMREGLYVDLPGSANNPIALDDDSVIDLTGDD